MNPLQDYPEARKVLYLVQFIVTGVLTVTAVGYGAGGHELPQWYAITTAVAGALWAYLGLTAAQHVNTTKVRGEDMDDERGAIYVGPFVAAIVVVLVVLIFLAVFGVI